MVQDLFNDNKIAQKYPINMLVYKNRASKIKFFWCQGIFFMSFYLKNELKNNFCIITKNHAAHLEKGFLTKSLPKPYGRATAMPPA